MTKIIIAYVAVLATLLVLDFIWVGIVAKSFYASNIGFLYRAKPIIPAVAAFYLFYAAAIVYFVGIPSGGSVIRAVIVGAFLGFTAYMTYDLVNYAVIKGWPFIAAAVDIGWGVVITVAASIVAALVL